MANLQPAGQPKVSIGLPVYNGERHLGEAVESILNQTFEKFELLISDNASTDGTEAICRDYAARDSRIRYSRLDRNMGAGPNFNRTFEMTNGQYFKWAAHDDRLAPTYLERCVASLDANPAAVLCQSQVQQIDQHGSPIPAVYEPLVGTSDASASTRLSAFILASNSSCVEIFGVIRRGALVGLPLHESYVGSDRAILAELLLRGSFVEIPERLFEHRDHPMRYVHTAYRDRKQRLVWYDPNKANDRTWHAWRLYGSFYAAVRRSALGWRERVRCYAILLCWLGVNKNIVQLAIDRDWYTLDPRLQAAASALKRRLIGPRRGQHHASR